MAPACSQCATLLLSISMKKITYTCVHFQGDSGIPGMNGTVGPEGPQGMPVSIVFLLKSKYKLLAFL